MSIIEITLKFKRQVNDFLIGVDEQGNERWFERKKYPGACYDGAVLRVTVDAKQWAKRLACQNSVRTERKVRHCMRCRRSFTADTNQFICDPCKKSDDWKTGFTVFDTP